MNNDFHRIRRLPPYVFEEVNRLKAGLRAKGVDIIDFGMGNPDMPTPRHIVDKLVETVKRPKTHGYSASKGIAGLRRAMAGYYDRRFGVSLNPDSEVVVTLGSKEGFANLAQALTAPGDVVICPNPAYPIHAYGFIMAGGVIRHVPAPTPEAYLSGISRAVKHSAPPASMFAWAPIPEAFQEAGSMLFAKLLMEEAGVAVAPGVGFGEYGEGFVRIGLVENEHRIRQAARNVKKFLQSSGQILSRAREELAAVEG